MYKTSLWHFMRIALLTVTLSATTLSGPTQAASWFDDPPSMSNDQERPPRPPKEGGFEKDDADGDGQVTRKEFSGPSDLFERMDRDGDGVISREETKPPQGKGQRPPR